MKKYTCYAMFGLLFTDVLWNYFWHHTCRHVCTQVNNDNKYYRQSVQNMYVYLINKLSFVKSDCSNVDIALWILQILKPTIMRQSTSFSATAAFSICICGEVKFVNAIHMTHNAIECSERILCNRHSNQNAVWCADFLHYADDCNKFA